MICANPKCGKTFKPKEARLKCCSRECGIAYKRTPEYRERLRHLTLKSWRDDPTGGRARGIAKMRETQRSPRRREAMAAENRRRWADPEFRAKTRASLKRALGRPEVRAQLSAALSARWKDPAWRARMVNILSEVQSTPQARENHALAMRRRIAEHGMNWAGLEAARKTMEEIWADPVRHAEMIDRILSSRRETYARQSSPKGAVISAKDVADATLAILLDEHGKARFA
jgi:hypothetical protein